MTTAAIRTRTEYLAGKCSHSDYYSQFVTPETLAYVEAWFPAEALREALAEDTHLNTIRLQEWDAMTWKPTGLFNDHLNASQRQGSFRAILPFDAAALTEAKDIVTRATLTCIAKQAARMIAGVA